MPSGGARPRAGRKRKPVELKVLEGSFRKDRDGERPVLANGTFPEPPPHLSESERQLWASFPRVPWIDDTNAAAVESAVAVYDRLLKIRAGRTDDPLAGLQTELQCWGRLLSILEVLGLTPSSRGKMQTKKLDEHTDDKWSGIL